MMRFCLIDQKGEKRWEEASPLALVLRRDADTPADSLEVTFDAKKPVTAETPCALMVYAGDTVLFSGIVDEHSILMDDTGREEFFSCRSRIGLLMDNEAMPGVLRMPSLRLMEKLFLSPFGLTLGQNGTSPKGGELTVEKGTSCFTVLRQFARRFLGTELHCTKDGTVLFSERVPEKIKLQSVMAAEILYQPYARISRVVVQNTHSGAYNTVYENPVKGGALRVRYLSAGALSAPKTVFAAGERKAVRVRVTCAAWIDATPGDLCDLSRFGAEFSAMRLESLCCRVTRDGEKTELTFSRVSEDA